MQTLDGKFATEEKAAPAAPPAAPAVAPARLDRRAILDAPPRLVPLDVPEWGGQVMLRPMSVATLVRVEADRADMAPLDFFPYLVSISVCDEAGALLFDEKDRPALAAKDFDVLKRVADEIMRVNGMGEGAQEAAAKNS